MENNKRKGYTLITNNFWSNPELNYKEKIILGEMLSYSEKFIINGTQIAKALGTHRNRVYDSLSVLLEKGYLYREAKQSNKGFEEVLWSLTPKSKEFRIYCNEKSAVKLEKEVKKTTALKMVNGTATKLVYGNCTENGVLSTNTGLSINTLSTNTPCNNTDVLFHEEAESERVHAADLFGNIYKGNQ